MSSKQQILQTSPREKVLDSSLRRISIHELQEIFSKSLYLEKLDLSGCNLTELPSNISSLTSLKELCLGQKNYPWIGNIHLKSLPEQMCSTLHNLEKLSLSECDLTQLPSNIGSLTSLKELYLGGNPKLKHQLEEIFSTLHNLEKLSLSECDLTKLPSNIGSLTSLKELYLYRNSNLKSLPEQMCSTLHNLEKLSLWQCDLTQLPSNIGSLTSLKELELYGNSNLKSLPEQMCSTLHNLEKLSMSRCDLTQLPSNIDSLSNLRHLDATNCSLVKLPATIVKLPNLRYLDVRSNSLNSPPQGVCDQGFDAICDFFSYKVKKASKRFKVVVLGEAFSGKTSLIQSMIRNEPFLTNRLQRTIGLEEHDVQLSDDKTAKILDCGGQRTYLLSNQLFVSENALILIVVDINDYETTDDAFQQHIYQYLRIAYDRIRKCYVLIVFTKNDPGSNRNSSLYQLDVEQRLRQFQDFRDRIRKERHLSPSQRQFFDSQTIEVDTRLLFTSAKDVSSVRHLKQFVDRLSQNSQIFPTVRDVLPESWFEFEKKLLSTCAKNPHRLCTINLGDANKLGRQFNLEEKQVQFALNYYHQIGTLLYFQSSTLAHLVFGSTTRLVHVLKMIFCHNYDSVKVDTVQMNPQTFQEGICQLQSNATASIPLLKCLLHLDNDEFDIVIIILLVFDFAYIKPTPIDLHCFDHIAKKLEKANAHLLLPWLLSQQLPEEVTRLFPTHCPQHSTEVGFQIRFVFALPLGAFQKFSARCHKLTPFIRHWNLGFFLSHGSVDAQFTCDAKNLLIDCRARAIDSHNALHRLLHLLWRCVVQLKELLYDVPGCLFDAHFTYRDGAGLHIIDQQIQIPEPGEKFSLTASADRKYAGRSNWMKCQETVTEVLDALMNNETLNVSVPDTCSDVFSLQKAASLALSIEKCCKIDGINYPYLLARCLRLPHLSHNDVYNILEEWTKEFRDKATLAVLTDALQQCGLHSLNKQFFINALCKNQKDDCNEAETHGCFSTNSSEKDHSQRTPTGEELNELSKHILRKWKFVASYLNLEQTTIEAIDVDGRDARDKAYDMLNSWVKQEGNSATVAKLFKALLKEDYQGVARKIFDADEN